MSKNQNTAWTADPDLFDWGFVDDEVVLQAIELAVDRGVRSYGGYAEADDLRQEAYMWLAARPDFRDRAEKAGLQVGAWVNARVYKDCIRRYLEREVARVQPLVPYDEEVH